MKLEKEMTTIKVQEFLCISAASLQHRKLGMTILRVNIFSGTSISTIRLSSPQI